MAHKTLAILTAILTAIMLIAWAAIIFFGQMVLLNGVTTGQASSIMTLTLGCQGVTGLLSTLLAGWLANYLVARFHWNKVFATIAAILAGVLCGGMLALLAGFLTISIMGVR